MVRLLKTIWNEFIYGGHLLSIGGVGIIVTTLMVTKSEFNIWLLLIVYLGNQTVYNYNRLREIKNDEVTNPERVGHIKKLQKKYPLIIIGYCIAFIIISVTISIQVFLSVFFLLTAGILYSIKLKVLTKKILLFKNFYIALLWALLGFVPLVYYSLPFTLVFFFFLTFIFLRLFLNTIFFDIKDIESDKQEALKTLPVTIGKRKTLFFLHGLNIFSFIPIICAVYFEILPLFSLGFIVFYPYSFYYLQKGGGASPEQIRSLSYKMVDAEYVFWPLVLMLTQTIFPYVS